MINPIPRSLENTPVHGMECGNSLEKHGFVERGVFNMNGDGITKMLLKYEEVEIAIRTCF